MDKNMDAELQAKFDALPEDVRGRISNHARRLTKNDYQQLPFEDYLEALVKHYFSGWIGPKNK